MNRRLPRVAIALGLAYTLVTPVHSAEPPLGPLYVVPTPIRSYRLLSMSRDEEGAIWVGSIHRTLHRYVPETGEVTTIPLPYDATVCSCLCVGKKVYILGQSYPKLITYDRTDGQFREFAYPSTNPDVWYGVGPVADRYLYLFDRNGGLTKWDTQSDTCALIPYPYDGPLPGGGHIDPRDGALWCRIWDLVGGQYRMLGLARLDLQTDTFTDYQQFPASDVDLQPHPDPEAAFYFPDSLAGRLIPFDIRRKTWHRPIPVPEFGQRFGFLGGPWESRGRYYYSMSTYDGDDLGCDGRPFHFCNEILEFDPSAAESHFLTLDIPGTYHQIAYMLADVSDFFATGTNIREPDGTLRGDRAGEVVFWQTIRSQKGNRPAGTAP